MEAFLLKYLTLNLNRFLRKLGNFISCHANKTTSSSICSAPKAAKNKQIQQQQPAASLLCGGGGVENNPRPMEPEANYVYVSGNESTVCVSLQLASDYTV